MDTQHFDKVIIIILINILQVISYLLYKIKEFTECPIESYRNDEVKGEENRVYIGIIIKFKIIFNLFSNNIII